MVVCGKKRAYPFAPYGVQIFDHGPCYGYAVVCAGAAPYLVEQHERSRCGVVENVRRFEHLHHECRLSLRDVVRSAHAREYLVDYAYACFGGGHERPGLGEQRYQPALPEQCRFTCHVGPGYYHYLLFLVIETYVVGDVGLAYGHQAFYYGVTPVLYIYYGVVR